jgi:hypothetical protein
MPGRYRRTFYVLGRLMILNASTFAAVLSTLLLTDWRSIVSPSACLQSRRIQNLR